MMHAQETSHVVFCVFGRLSGGKIDHNANQGA